MIYLLLALLFSTLIMVNFKLYPKLKIDILQSIVTNYLVAFLAGWVSLSFLSPQNLISEDWFPLSIASGTMLILVFFVFATSAAKVGIAITSVSSKMSVLIPVILGFLIFKEEPALFKIMGIALSLPAFYFIFKRNENFNLKGILLLLPILLFLGNGTNDSLMKSAEYFFLRGDGDLLQYLTSAFAISFCIGIGILIVVSIRKRKKIQLKNIGAGIILGLLNWFSTLFFLKGLSHIDVSVFVPVFNVGIVSFGALVGLIFFRERLGKWNIFGLLLAIVSILLIALGYD
jgi:drug/metabolite transporter (DMT)-like permease